MRCVGLLMLAMLGCGSPASGVKGFEKAGDPARLQATQNRYVLAIGIDQYDAASGWRSLQFPDDDARAMAAALKAGGDYEVVDVLTGRLTATQIINAFDRLKAKVKRSSDVALVYVSGHGTLAQAPNGAVARYLVPSNARLDDVRGTAVAISTLKARFAALASQRKVMIMATCHAGAGKSGLPAPLLSQLATQKSAFFAPPIESVSRASVLIGASGWGEPAREDPELGHDIYTYYLLEAIRQAYDPDKDGATTITEAHDYARRLTWRRSAGRQRAALQSDILGVDPIVLAGKAQRPAMPLLLSFNPVLQGVAVVIDGQTKGQLPGNVVVPPGRHHVQLRAKNGSLVAEDTLSLRAGSRVVLDGLIEAPDGVGWSASAGIGYQAFLDSQSRADLVEPLALPRIAVQRHGPGWHAFAEVAGTVGAAENTARLPTASGRKVDVPYRLSEYSVGLGAWFEVGRIGAFNWGLGPVFNMVYFSRQLDLVGADDESYLGAAPAVEVAGQYRLSRDLFAKLGARGSYLAFQVDAVWRHIALLDVWLATGVMF